MSYLTSLFYVVDSKIGLDVIDQNLIGLSDDFLGNDGDGDNNSLTKSKLNLNMAKDKKKTFFKKVRSVYFILTVEQMNAHATSHHLSICQLNQFLIDFPRSFVLFTNHGRSRTEIFTEHIR